VKPSYRRYTLHGYMANFALMDNHDLAELDVDDLHKIVLREFDEDPTDDHDTFRQLRRKVAAEVLILRKLEDGIQKATATKPERIPGDPPEADESSVSREDQSLFTDVLAQFEKDRTKLKALKRMRQWAETDRVRIEQEKAIDEFQDAVRRYDSDDKKVRSRLEHLKELRLAEVEANAEWQKILDRVQQSLDEDVRVVEETQQHTKETLESSQPPPPKPLPAAVEFEDKAVGDYVIDTHLVGAENGEVGSIGAIPPSEAFGQSSIEGTNQGLPKAQDAATNTVIDDPLDNVKIAVSSLTNAYGTPAVVGGAVLAGLSLSTLGAFVWSLFHRGRGSSSSPTSRDHSRKWRVGEDD